MQLKGKLAPKTKPSVAANMGIQLLTTKEKEVEQQLTTLTKDRGRWGQLRSLKGMRKIDIKEVATTSIKLTWDPTPTRPFKTVGYRISMQEVGRGGFLPVVEDTLEPVTTYCGTKLKPDTHYRFHIAR